MAPKSKAQTKEPTKKSGKLPAASGPGRPPRLAAPENSETVTWHVFAWATLAAAVSAWVVAKAQAWWRTPKDFPHILEIDRLNFDGPESLRTFFDDYHGKRPVVIEGALDGWPAMQWSSARLAELCPSARLDVYSFNRAASAWAGLQEEGEWSLVDYLGQFGDQGGKLKQGRAVFGLEMSLRSECPRLLQDVRIPAFFADDLLVRYYKKSAWPTLIAGPKGTRSGLHRDTHDLAFWMAVFVGRKRWRIFLPEDYALDPLFLPDRNGFAFDPFAPDLWSLPGLRRARVYEHILSPGQLLYIPSGAPHAAVNLDDTITISANYLDTRGLDLHIGRTCQQDLWRESKLCWFHTADFQNHKPTPTDELSELTFFEYAGASGAASWCEAFLPELRGRSEKRPELGRCVDTVSEYCATKA
eukprot:CAMPEP_0203909198 /NCGR_PEP_ID=MMETSP0359-20131031/50514_1 /ASSEMBLY_ACC=CAM_ASM_000338 /TAXON_ID=268821 /ORGANISM="Scrippsiella Hangoei, Strain SHTV-5" /LENGTH=413 /DNA_ID=CAMNT_0050834385 /DNA_START=8 /DNA_END=1249 /DNA_ORIENTATION=-